MDQGAAPRLVGRASELGVLSAVAARARSGDAAAVLVEGEAGIGKTCVVDALAGIVASQGWVVLRGASYALGQGLPFGAIAELLDLRRTSGDARRAALAALLRGEMQGGADLGVAGDLQYRLVEDVVELVEEMASRAPVAMFIEDLHWADPSTLLIVRTIAARLRHVPVLLVGTLRPLPRPPELVQLREDLSRMGGLTLDLGPLDDADVAALVRWEVGGCPGPVLREIVMGAGGNPLWVVETVRSLSAERQLQTVDGVVDAVGPALPASVSELVDRRLSYLPPATLELLRLASVLGDPFLVSDLARVARLPLPEAAQALDAGFRARLLSTSGDAVRFRHQLVRDAVYGQIPLPTRVGLHRDIAGILARASAPLPQVAAHMSLGATPGDVEAVRWLWDAAREALPRAPAVTAELLRRAAALLPAGHPERDLVTADLVEALSRAGLVAEAAELARATLRRPHHADVALRLRLGLVSVLSLQNRPAELLAEFDSGLLDLPGLSPGDEALVLSQASWGKTFSGDPVGGEEAAWEATRRAERLEATPLVVSARGALCVAVKTQGRYQEALAIAEETVRVATASGDREALRRHPHFYLAMALADADRLEEARAAYGLVLAGCDEIGAAWIRPDTHLLLGELRFLTGDWDDAVVELEAGLDMAAEHGTRLLMAQSRAYLAVMAVYRGRADDARRVLAGCEEELSKPLPGYGAELLAYAAALLGELEGRQSDAEQLLERAWDRDLTSANRYYHRWLGPLLVRLALNAGRRSMASAAAEAVVAGAELGPSVASVEAAGRRCAGLVAGDPGLMLDAVRLAAASPRALDHAQTCEDASAVIASSGAVGEARHVLEQALATYERLGASAAQARVASALRRLGVSQGRGASRTRPPTGWQSLTDTEVKVAYLVAEGLTNRAIATRLYVSPHTVNSHLRHIFQKTGVSTRAGLAALAIRTA